MPQALDLIGVTFGRLTAIKRSNNRGPAGEILWICQCSCNKKIEVRTASLRNGKTRSCGCLHHDAMIPLRRNGFGTPELKAWKNMIRRCTDKNQRSWKNYGGRGIKVCKRWFKFENFLKDMGPMPSPSHTVERDNVDGHYCKSNCHWDTKANQTRNQRRSRKINYNGKMTCVAVLARKLGIDRKTLTWRLDKGWPIKIATSEQKFPANQFTGPNQWENRT